jgi:hypothetical protein
MTRNFAFGIEITLLMRILPLWDLLFGWTCLLDIQFGRLQRLILSSLFPPCDL